MLSNKPYLLRAFYQWIVDSNCTPIIVIDAHHPRSKIPKEYVEDGEIVFNISPVAIRDLKISNELVEFKASFSGVIHLIATPISTILALYAEENGEGIFFDAEDENKESTEEVPLTRLQPIDVPEGDNIERAPQQMASISKNKPVLKLVE